MEVNTGVLMGIGLSCALLQALALALAHHKSQPPGLPLILPTAETRYNAAFAGDDCIYTRLCSLGRCCFCLLPRRWLAKPGSQQLADSLPIAQAQ